MYKLAITGFAAVLLTATSVLAQTPVQLTVPSKVVARAIIADLTNGIPISQQLTNANRQVQYSWDFTANCISEMRGDFGLASLNPQAPPMSKGDSDKKDDTAHPPRVTCDGKTTTLDAKGKCVTVADATFSVQTNRTNYFTNTFNTYVGIVSDPFEHNTNSYHLWKSSTSLKSWLWLDHASNDIVYLQDVDPVAKKMFVYYFPDGFTDAGVSAYNFQLFQCIV
jgi:hypothetical protein